MKSILETEPYCYCYACGQYGQLEEHHIYYGRKQRRAAERTGLKVHLCQLCHGKGREGVHGWNIGLNMWLKEIAQMVFEKTHSHEEFMSLLGENFIGVEKMNHITTTGRLTTDPVIKHINLENPRPVAQYIIAPDTEEDVKDGTQSASSFNVMAFDDFALFAVQSFQKGSQIRVSGRIVTCRHDGKAGRKACGTAVYATDQEIINSKGAAATKELGPAGAGFMIIPDGVETDLPFCL